MDTHHNQPSYALRHSPSRSGICPRPNTWTHITISHRTPLGTHHPALEVAQVLAVDLGRDVRLRRRRAHEAGVGEGWWSVGRVEAGAQGGGGGGGGVVWRQASRGGGGGHEEEVVVLVVRPGGADRTSSQKKTHARTPSPNQKKRFLNINNSLTRPGWGSTAGARRCCPPPRPRPPGPAPRCRGPSAHRRAARGTAGAPAVVVGVGCGGCGLWWWWRVWCGCCCSQHLF